MYSLKKLQNINNVIMSANEQMNNLRNKINKTERELTIKQKLKEREFQQRLNMYAQQLQNELNKKYNISRNGQSGITNLENRLKVEQQTYSNKMRTVRNSMKEADLVHKKIKKDKSINKKELSQRKKQRKAVAKKYKLKSRFALF